MKILSGGTFGRTAVAGLLGLTAACSGLIAAVAALPAAMAEQGFVTAVKPYVVPVDPRYSIKALLSAGDRVPETSNPSRQYQMVGIPDGLGAHRNSDGTITFYMNHELVNTVESETVPGVEVNRGAIVSKYILASDGSVLSGERAYDTVYLENTLIGPAAETGNSTPGFGRLCSGTLVGPREGFSTHIYFPNEEATGAATFDGKGGLAVAVIDNAAYALPKLGRFAWENTVPMRTPNDKTVIIGMEDGPSTPDSQLWLYVGTRVRSPGSTILRSNGLDNGKLYVFVSDTPGMRSEVEFQSGTIEGHWVEIQNAENLTDVALEAAADAVGAFGFIRTEDGTFNKRSRADYYFVTTGSSFTAPGASAPANKLGRLYHLELSRGNPATQPSKLTVVYNADQVINAGGDIAISPDNIDTSRDFLMINEDGTTESRAVMTAKGRDGSVWRFEISDDAKINVASATRVASLNPPGRDGIAVLAGVWETSGVLDATRLFGNGTWLTDVQAHSPTTAPLPGTVEDGQLVLMRGPSDDDDEQR